MSSWATADAAGASVALTAPELQAGPTLLGSSPGYSVLEFLGEGCFGKVAKCQSLATKETVAVKIPKNDFIRDTEKEVSILEVISVLNTDRTNVVKFFERFEHMGQICLAFEMLDRNLYDLLQERDWKPLSLNEIRPVAKQVLVALDALKGLGILHTDIKPENIMFVNMQDQPLRVTLIDFGEAIPASKVQPGMVLQPEHHLLRAGKYTRYFFSEAEAADGPTWRLMTPEEYTAANSVKPEKRNSFIDLPGPLDALVNIYPKADAATFEDRRAFVDLMKQLLHLDGDQRISPHQALQHPFITMSHLSEHPDSRAYLITSQTMMSVCPVADSAVRVNTSAACEPDQESASGFSVRELPSGSNDSAPATRSFDGTTAIVSYDEGPTTGPSDGAKPTDFTAAASASSGQTNTLLKRIRRFFRGNTATFCCCCRRAVED